MEVEIRVEPGRQEPKLVILAGEESGELRQLAASLSKLALGPVPVGEAVPSAGRISPLLRRRKGGIRSDRRGDLHRPAEAL